MAALATHHATASSSAADLRDQEAVAANSSAVDLSEVAIPSLDIPHKLTSDRVRRRSDLSRIPPTSEPDAIELPVISEHGLTASSSLPTPDISFREDVIFVPSKNDDVEIAPSFPNSLAPSIKFDDDTDSTVPAISASQKAVQRRKFLLTFLSLCFSVFLNGWNDGTTGPLLPRIQSYYNVRVRLVEILVVYDLSLHRLVSLLYR